MRNKIIKGGILALALLCVFTGPALAEGNIRIGDDNAAVLNYRVETNTGAYINPETAITAGLLDFFTSPPSDPMDDTGSIARGAGVGQYSMTWFPALHYWEYFFKINDSGITVRAWTGTKAMGETNFYGYQNSGYADDGTTPVSLRLGPSGVPSNQYMGTFKTVYQAMPPYTPVIDRNRDITESQVRDDYSTRVNLTLAVTVNPGTGTPPRQISASSPGNTNYELEITYPDGSVHTEYTNGTYTLTGTPIGLYRFRAKAYNWFGGSDWSGYAEWQTLTGGMAGPETITVHFVKPPDDLGINTFSFPFSEVSSPSAISNLKHLIEAVNKAANKNVATVAGLWDKSKQNPSGYIITYDSDTLNDFGNFIKAGEVPDDPAGLALVKDGAYQISVIENDIDLIMTGTR